MSRRPAKRWSDTDEHVMRRMHAAGHTVAETAKHLNRVKSVIRTHAKASGLEFAAQRREWTKSELRTLRQRYPNEYAKDVAKALGRKTSQVHGKANALGLKKSDAFWAGDKSTRIKRGQQSDAMRASQFKKGLKPWNKGKPGSAGTHPNCRKTQFKKGCMTGAAQHNYVPIGTERISGDGMLERKVTDDPSIYPARRWVSVARLVWESEHGPIPPRHVVRFRAGMHTSIADEITTDKLECISQAENMRRNSYHRYPQPIPQLIQLRGALTRKINNRTEKDHQK